MINLLDLETKRDLKAARINVVLATYCAIVGLAVVSVAVLALFSYWWLNNQIVSANAQKTANESATGSYADVKQQAAQFTANLGKIQSVLSNRSHYNTALLNIAASLPSGAYINNASMSAAFATTPLKITASAPTNQAALALKEQLGRSKIFSKVTIDSVNCGGDNGNGCVVSLTATLNQATIFTPGATE